MSFAYCPLCKKNVRLRRKISKILVALLLAASVFIALCALFTNAISAMSWLELAVWIAIIDLLYIIYKIASPTEVCSECGLDAVKLLPPVIPGFQNSYNPRSDDSHKERSDCTIRLCPLDKLGKNKVIQFVIVIDNRQYELIPGRDLNISLSPGSHNILCGCRYSQNPLGVKSLYTSSVSVNMDLSDGDTITAEYDEQTNSLTVVKL